jgi:two-component system, NarL family, sensor histidine kinase DesK
LRKVRGYRGSGLKAELGRAKVALDAAGIALSSNMADLNLPPSLEPVLELTLCEAITNVVRHSRAKNCQIQVLQTPQHIQLEVSDDGVGMVQTGSLEGREGTGLSSIRERLRAVGGSLEINPNRSSKNPSRGTLLQMRVPL